MKAPTTAEIRRAWDRNAATWAEHVRERDLTRRHIVDPALLRLLGDVRGRRVLDAGCGDGHHARQLARSGARVVGVDVSGEMISLARAEERRSPLGITYSRASLSGRVAFGDRRFELILVTMTLMALPNHRSALRTLTRALAPGGRLLATVPHPCFFAPDDEDYFTPAAMTWSFYDGQVAATPYFHRPIAEYAHACRAAGLTLLDIHEPKAPRVAGADAAVAVHEKIPAVVIFEACRAGAERGGQLPPVQRE